MKQRRDAFRLRDHKRTLQITSPASSISYPRNQDGFISLAFSWCALDLGFAVAGVRGEDLHGLFLTSAFSSSSWAFRGIKITHQTFALLHIEGFKTLPLGSSATGLMMPEHRSSCGATKRTLPPWQVCTPLAMSPGASRALYHPYPWVTRGETSGKSRPPKFFFSIEISSVGQAKKK